MTENNIMVLKQTALLFATAAHGAVGQVRKYTGEPYITHPIEVASIVKSVSHTPEMVAAAYLHDVVEDTNVTLDIIAQHFGTTVAEYVQELTDPPKTANSPNRKTRKAFVRDKLAFASAEVQTIKLADLISNSQSIVLHDPNFARTYLREKAELLEVLVRGDKHLHERATKILHKGLAELNK